MAKPNYYLWKTEDISMEEIERKKQHWKALGFRVVTFVDGSKEKDINEGIKAVIKNHITS